MVFGGIGFEKLSKMLNLEAVKDEQMYKILLHKHMPNLIEMNARQIMTILVAERAIT